MPSTRRGVYRPFATVETGDTLHLTWMLKSFAMGVTLLGLSYWLIQIAGIQYLASLTSIILLAFMFAYVVWCVLHRNKVARQRSDGSNRTETTHASSTVGNTEPLTPAPPPPFDCHQSFKYITRTPGRDQSPPPTYEEAIRAMMRPVTFTQELTCHQSVSPDTGPRSSQQEQAEILASPAAMVSASRLNSSTTQLSPLFLMPSPTQSALTCSLSSSSALMPYSPPVEQTISPLTGQLSGLTSISQSVETTQQSVTLNQTSPTTLTPASTVLVIPSEHPTPHTES